MLQQAIEREVAEYVDAHAHERDAGTGRRLVVRNGHLPARQDAHRARARSRCASRG